MQTWKQKSVKLIAAITVSGGVTTVDMKKPHPTPCQTPAVDSLP
jgi:hypothetical protein